MLEETRKEKIIEFMKERGEVTVNKVAELLNVSGATIRKDLSNLEELGLVVRTHGGAVLPSHTKVEWNFIQKSKQHVGEKKAIAKKAMEFISPGDSIILDSGTTTLAMAREIKRANLHPLTIVTNNLFIATELVGTSVDLIVLGGNVRENSFSLIGGLCENGLTKVYVDKAFIGTTGASEKGFMTPNINEAKIKTIMISQSRENFIVADSSKFERSSFAIYTTFELVDHMITDWNISHETEEMLKKSSVDVIKAIDGRK